MSTIRERLFDSAQQLKNIPLQVRFADVKPIETRIALLEEYATQFAEALAVLCEAKEKGL